MDIKKPLTQIQLNYREKWMVQGLDDGLSLQDIAEIFSVTKARVYQITNNYRARQIKK